MKTKKQLKTLKKNIINNSAINVGYYEVVINKLPNYALIEAIKEVSLMGCVKKDTSDSEIKNIIITESVRHINYQDFKDISNYFFN